MAQFTNGIIERNDVIRHIFPVHSWFVGLKITAMLLFVDSNISDKSIMMVRILNTRFSILIFQILMIVQVILALMGRSAMTTWSATLVHARVAILAPTAR